MVNSTEGDPGVEVLEESPERGSIRVMEVEDPCGKKSIQI